MKNIYFLGFALLALLAFSACDEIPPTISGGGTTIPPGITNQPKQILVEEFTGVQCVNCPAGSSVLKDLKATYGEQLVVLSIHTGDFAIPSSHNNIDFRTSIGDNVAEYIGTPFFYPIASIDRRLYDGEFGLLLNRNKWAGYISDLLSTEPEVRLDATVSFSESDRNLTVNTTIIPSTTVSSDQGPRISVIVTEDGIVDAQLTPESSPDYDLNYIHDHVFRGMMTAFDGDPITENLTEGVTIEKSYSMNIPTEWNTEKMKVIIFVHESGANKDVLQVIERDF